MSDLPKTSKLLLQICSKDYRKLLSKELKENMMTMSYQIGGNSEVKNYN